jgi:hypothetical protein
MSDKGGNGLKPIASEGKQDGEPKITEVTDITLTMLEKAIQGIYFDSRGKRLIVIFRNKIKAIEFVNDDKENGPVYYFSIHRKAGNLPYLDRYKRGVSAYIKKEKIADGDGREEDQLLDPERKKIKEILIELDKEGKVVVLSDQNKSIPHEQFTQMPGLVRIDIYIKEPGQILRLPIRDVGDILKEVEGESA